MSVKTKKITWIVGALLASILLAVIGQNCSGLKIDKNSGSSNSGSASSNPLVYKSLRAPEREKRPVRIVFLIDQSWSMVGQPCPGDIDYISPENGYPVVLDDPEPCIPAPGNDFNGMRFAAVKKMLQQLQFDPNDSTYDIKIALIPFSGGPGFGSRGNTKFYKPTSALDDIQAPANEVNLASLLAEHNQNKGQLETANSPMQTTSLANAIDAASDLISSDMALQKAAHSLSQTRYQVIALTDGLMRGRFEEIRRAFNFYSITYILPARPANSVCLENPPCNDAYNCPSMTPGWNLISDPVNECPYLWRSLQFLFGNMQDATATGVAYKVLRLVANFRANGVRTPGIAFLRLTTPFMPEGSFSESDAFMKNLSRLSGFPTYDLISANNLPLNLAVLVRNSVAKSYRLKNLVIRNLNAKIDSSGRLRIDSDGDGVPDDDEDNESAIHQIRSNGYCLDSIVKKVGCVTDDFICKKLVDVDRDGLNDCEERTLTSDRISFDSEFDGIPDMLEVVYGGSVLQNDKLLTSSGTGTSDWAKFMMGLSPGTPLPVNPSYKTDFVVSVDGSDRVTNSSGDIVTLERYAIRVKNIPLVKTEIAEPPQTLLDDNLGNPIDKSLIFGPTGHAAGINQILIYGEMSEVGSPETAFWIQQKIEVPFGSNVVFDIDPSRFKEIYFP